MTASLYRDPILDGATDPPLVQHQTTGHWWMFYTARRVTVPGPRFAWVHGSDIGVAVSTDGGETWLYRGTMDSLAIEPGHNTFWAPEILWAEGRYHVFVSYITGIPDRWEGHDRRILHHVSDDLVDWTYSGIVPLGSDRVIDAAVHALPSGRYRMWFKDEPNDAHTYCADSPNLETWDPARPVVTGFAHEGPNAFSLGGQSWMIVDVWHGLGVFRSDDLETWRLQGLILDEPGGHPDDRDYGRHADMVVVRPGLAYIFYLAPRRSVRRSRREPRTAPFHRPPRRTHRRGRPTPLPSRPRDPRGVPGVERVRAFWTHPGTNSLPHTQEPVMLPVPALAEQLGPS